MTDTSEQPAVVSAHIAASLRDDILSGRLGPGDRIRQEELATRFGTSRLPVREALRILEVAGLVSTQANRGARVPALTLQECSELYQVREQLEGLLIGASALQLSRAAVASVVVVGAWRSTATAGLRRIRDYRELLSGQVPDPFRN